RLIGCIVLAGQFTGIAAAPFVAVVIAVRVRSRNVAAVIASGAFDAATSGAGLALVIARHVRRVVGLVLVVGRAEHVRDGDAHGTASVACGAGGHYATSFLASRSYFAIRSRRASRVARDRLPSNLDLATRSSSSMRALSMRNTNRSVFVMLACVLIGVSVALVRLSL